MKYSGIRTNENLRFIKCPVCGNDEFSYDAEFCRICGSAIFNYCQDMYDESGYRISTGCGKPNPGNARYCEYCGNPTLLFKYLTDWEEEKKHADKYDGDDSDIVGSLEIDDNIEIDSAPVADKKENKETIETKENVIL
jgi:hypothetical protein